MGNCASLHTLPATVNLLESGITGLRNGINDDGLQLIFVCNDGCAQAAARALKEAGRDDIKICGYDGISSGVQSIIDGTMAASVAQDPYNIGYQCVKALCMAANGETIEKEIDTGSYLITKDNAEEYLETLNEYLK